MASVRQIPSSLGLSGLLREDDQYIDDKYMQMRYLTMCSDISKSFASSFGPNGMNKLVVNHLQKVHVTNDAATILEEIEFEIPLAKILVDASKIQASEIGDGTNFVMILAGSLIQSAIDLLKMGMSSSEIVSGYNCASKKALEILPTLTCKRIKDLTNIKEVTNCLMPVLMSKQYGNEKFLSSLVAKACVSIYDIEGGSFNVDNIRVCKILGSTLFDSTILNGMVFKSPILSDVTSISNAKICIFSCAFDIMQTETKGTVFIEKAEELMNYSKGEEINIEAQIKAIADSGCNVVVSGAKVGDLALHYANKYKLLVLKVSSKFDIRRLARTTSASVLPKLSPPPTADHLGFCDSVYEDEISGTKVTVLKQEKCSHSLSTIILRGSTNNFVDDVENTIEDGINAFKALTRNPCLVPGAGACEMELASKISAFGEKFSSLEQYSIKKFAECLESIPRALCDTSGIAARPLISKLYSLHANGHASFGVDIENSTSMNTIEAGILDLAIVKEWGLKFATYAASTIIGVEKIIMAKPAAGGAPGPKSMAPRDED